MPDLVTLATVLGGLATFATATVGLFRRLEALTSAFSDPEPQYVELPGSNRSVKLHVHRPGQPRTQCGAILPDGGAIVRPAPDDDKHVCPNCHAYQGDDTHA